MHTEEPWTLIDKPRNAHYRNAIPGRDHEASMQHCRYIAGPKHDSDFVADLITTRDQTGDANAERIVACVNFCREFPTEFIANHTLRYLKTGEFQSLADVPNFVALLAVAKNGGDA